MKTMKLRNYQGNLIEYKEAPEGYTAGCQSCALNHKPQCSTKIKEAVQAFGGGCAQRNVYYEVVFYDVNQKD